MPGEDTVETETLKTPRSSQQQTKLVNVMVYLSFVCYFVPASICSFLRVFAVPNRDRAITVLMTHPSPFYGVMNKALRLSHHLKVARIGSDQWSLVIGYEGAFLAPGSVHPKSSDVRQLFKNSWNLAIESLSYQFPWQGLKYRTHHHYKPTPCLFTERIPSYNDWAPSTIRLTHTHTHTQTHTYKHLLLSRRRGQYSGATLCLAL